MIVKKGKILDLDLVADILDGQPFTGLGKSELLLNITENKTMNIITIDDELINEIIAVSHYENAQEAVIKILSNYLKQQKKELPLFERLRFIDDESAEDELSSLLECVYLLRSPENAQRLFRALEWAETTIETPQTLAELKEELGIE